MTFNGYAHVLGDFINTDEHASDKYQPAGTPVEEIRALGIMSLRIEAFAEPMFAAAIVAYGVFVGAADTLVPCLMNFFSIWAVRLSLAALLAPSMGLKGVWIAMCVELCFRGLIFLVRLQRGKWIKIKG